jgi:hypothetical protein
LHQIGLSRLVTLEERGKGKKEKTTQAVKKHSPHKFRKWSHFGIGYHETPPANEKDA